MKQLKRKQKGFSLVELGITIGIIAVLIGIGFAIIPGLLASSRASAEINNIPTISTKIQSLFASAPNFANLTQAGVINLKAFPEEYVSGTTLSNRWGGTVTVAKASLAGGTDNAFSLTYTGVPSDECGQIGAGVARSVRTLQVGTATPKADGAALNPTTLGTACTTAASVTMVFTFGR